MVTLDALGQLMDLMRAHGCIQLRDGDTHVVLGPAPLAPGTPRSAPDPDAALTTSGTDDALVKEYQAHLYGGR
jgi:hypothetical protein